MTLPSDKMKLNIFVFIKNFLNLIYESQLIFPDMKKIIALNYVLSLILFVIIIGFFAKDPLLLGLSIIYCGVAGGFLPYGFNKKYIDGNSVGRILLSIGNATALISLIVCMVEYMLGVALMGRIVTISCIIFIGGCIFLYMSNRRVPSEQ